MSMQLKAGRLNIINLSASGTFEGSGQVSTRPQDVDDIFDHVKRSNVQHLILYFHGGRVSEKKGIEGANELMSLLAEEVQAHPVFFIWESSELEVIRGKLFKIGEDGLFKSLRNALATFVLGKIREDTGAHSGALSLTEEAEIADWFVSGRLDNIATSTSARQKLTDVTSSERLQFEEYLRRDPVFQASMKEVIEQVYAEQQTVPAPAATAGVVEPEREIMVSEEIQEALREEITESAGARGGVPFSLVPRALTAFSRIIGRFQDGTDHGLHATVVEEILRGFYVDKLGGEIWRGMKAQIADSFLDNDRVSSEAQHGGTYFLDRLSAYLQDETIPHAKVSLVGHSAGAIYICKLLEKAHTILPQDFRFEHIVMLAPAVDFDLFESTVLDHKERFASFRMYALKDELESKDSIASVVYPRSLLYFVSGLLEGPREKPLVGMQRYYLHESVYDIPSVHAARAFLQESGKSRAVWAIAANLGDGLNCGATGHGKFSGEAETRRSLRFLLRSRAS